MKKEETEFSKTGARFQGRFLFQDDTGEIIANEGPGKGFASYPWVLDDYERALGITPEEVWLLHRMIKHVWKSEGYSFFSMRKVSDNALLSRSRLDKLVKSLLRKGYISVAGRGNSMYDRRVRYDVSGVFNALLVAITCNPSSKYAEEHGVRTFASWFKSPPEQWKEYSTPAQVNGWENSRGRRFNWAEGKSEPMEANKNGYSYKGICEECDDEFWSNSPNTKYCPGCREEIRRERWHEFQNAFHEFEQTMEEEE